MRTERGIHPTVFVDTALTNVLRCAPHILGGSTWA